MRIFLAIGIVGIAASLLTSNVVAQTVHKCKSPSGRISYSDQPCDGAGTGTKFLIQQNSLSAATTREYMLRQENKRLKEQVRSQQQRPAAPASANTAAQITQPDLQAARIDTVACERAKRDYEVTASSTSNSPAIIDAKRSAMYGSCGMREPDKNQTIIIQRIGPVIR